MTSCNKKINIILQKNKQKFFKKNFVILFLTLKSYQTKTKENFNPTKDVLPPTHMTYIYVIKITYYDINIFNYNFKGLLLSNPE